MNLHKLRSQIYVIIICISISIGIVTSDYNNCDAEYCGEVHLSRLEDNALPQYHFQMLRDSVRNNGTTVPK